MKISELNDILGIDSSKLDYTFMVLNTAETAAGLQTTYKVSLKSLGNSIVEDFNVLMIDPNDNGHHIYSGTMSKNESDEYDTGLTMTEVGQYITSNDRTVLTGALTNVAYDTTNKKFTKTVYGTTTTDVVSTATLLSDMDLNITQITNTAGKTLATIDEASGKISATFQDISILSSQVSDKSDAINSSGSTLATSKAVKDAIESLDITQITNTADKTIATINEADGKVSATFQDIEVAQSQVTGLTTALGNKLETSLKGANSGLAELDANGHVPSSQLPSYVDDVIEGTIATFPATGETGKIYVDTTTNISYRWSGSQYVKVASDLALGETSSTAHRGDHGATAYTHATDASRLTTAQNSGMYKFAVSNEGHITSVTAIEKSDITGLGIPAQDTTYSTGTEFTSGITKLYTSYGSGIDGAITQNAFTVLMANMIINFGLTVALPSAAAITEDTTNGVLTVQLSGLNDHCTTIIQKQDNGSTWTTYNEGDSWAIGDIFRVYVTRTITVGNSTFTNSGVIGNNYTAATEWAPEESTEDE